MLQLKNINKTYDTGQTQCRALKNINISFRKSEFVSILGQSGSGKTTLLNIIGGLDRYTDGDLLINGVSTKKYFDEQWDSYRNNAVGFVFQSYNLIPHQSIIANVELSLTLSGITGKERRKRAQEALEKVGLGDHLNKKPNQLSGGQMQRVAIARALVNDPEILLADEPTGALDSETSVQIMELLKEISKDRLVIMVTHNPELANEYSTRIIRLHDGEITQDTDPYEEEEKADGERRKFKLPMPIRTALSLSFNNLKTKKGRTILTAFAGSIGIIGIALVLALSSGMQDYIAQTEEDMLSSFPITIQSETIDALSTRQEIIDEKTQESEEHSDGKIYQKGFAGTSMRTASLNETTNDLGAFQEYIESTNGNKIKNNAAAIQYGYDVDLQIYSANTANGAVKIEADENSEDSASSDLSSIKESFGVGGSEIFSELIGNRELIESQYELVAGKYPTAYNEVVLVVDANNEIDDITLYSLGLKDRDEYEEIKSKTEAGETVNSSDYETASYTYEDILNLKFKLVSACDYYEKKNGVWVDKRSDADFLTELVNNGTEIQVVSILKAAEDSSAQLISGSIGYLSSLTQFVSEAAANSEIVKEQLAAPDTNVFTGGEFIEITENTSATDILGALSSEQRRQLLQMDEENRMSVLMSLSSSISSSLSDNLKALGYADESEPASVSIYLNDFNSRETIIEEIDRYNELQSQNGNSENRITYTDTLGMITSSVNRIINMFTYLLIGFVSISLIVSSVMIGIITYISVLERTKEIGILRSIGASKSDISRVFNAETFIIGLSSGLMGVIITILLIIPINLLIEHLSGVAGLAALPWLAGVILVAISVGLTMLAGLVPSKMAAKKDPVTALRTE